MCLTYILEIKYLFAQSIIHLVSVKLFSYDLINVINDVLLYWVDKKNLRKNHIEESTFRLEKG